MKQLDRSLSEDPAIPECTLTVLMSRQLKSPYTSVRCDLLIYSYQNEITDDSNNDHQTSRKDIIFRVSVSLWQRRNILQTSLLNTANNHKS